MHPDSPIRQLDEIIRRYGVTCLQLIPFDGGYVVHLGSRAKPVSIGGGSLPEAIGKAFIELIRLQGGPSVEELIEKSSLGTPRAKALRASADPRVVQKVIRRSEQIRLDIGEGYVTPSVHLLRHGVRESWTASCGLRFGTGARHTEDPALVTCGRCRNTGQFRKAAVARGTLS